MLRVLKPCTPGVVLFGLLLQPAIARAEYQSGTLVAVEKTTKITPIDYIYETVVSYYETVTYELQIRVGADTYFARYTPEVQPNWPLPSEWGPNQPIQLRLEKHRLVVKLKSDGEITTFIAHHSRVKSP
jgi:hypothetical protein